MNLVTLGQLILLIIRNLNLNSRKYRIKELAFTIVLS